MDLIDIITAVLLTIAVGASVYRLVSSLQIEARSKRRSQRAELLAQMGLSTISDRTGADRAEGVVGDLNIRYRADAPHGWSVRLSTGELSLHPKPAKAYRERFVKLGDASFDALYALWGRAADLAWLGPEVRATLVHLADKRPQIRDGWLQITSPVFQPQNLDLVVAIARQIMARPSDGVERLEQMLCDPTPAVRSRCLWSLRATAPELVLRLAPVLLDDSDAEVRAMAAILLKDPVGLYLAATDRALPHETRKEAVGWLRSTANTVQRQRAGEMLIREDLMQLAGIDLLRSVGFAGEEALLSLVGRVDDETLAHVLLALAEMGSIHAIRALNPERSLNMLSISATPLRARAMRLLFAKRGVGEEVLLSLVGRVDDETLAHVLLALVEVGSIRAVPILRARQETLSLLQRSLSRAIDQTIATIQQRAGGEHGELMLVPSAGALSEIPKAGDLSATAPHSATTPHSATPHSATPKARPKRQGTHG